MKHKPNYVLYAAFIISLCLFLYIFLTWWYQHDQVIMLGALL
jgi:hypothetical protein